jgi:glycosyltransferase involved in cell wall biosynthesis
MNKFNVTILTDPLPIGSNLLYVFTKYIFRLLRNLILRPKQFYYGSNYGGHPAVTRSLVNGFKKCKINFNYNPIKLDDLSKNVIVLSGLRTLKQAIYLKKKGYIKKIFAGPNIVTFSYEHNFLLSASEIDVIIVPSKWVRSHYIKDLPSIKKKIFIWPAGVDISYWSPKSKKSKNQILIYDKTSSIDSSKLKSYIGFLKSLSLNYKILSNVKSHHYTSEQFRELLQSSILMIGLTNSESQGICWAEAWAMNIPTLLNFKSVNLIRGHRVFISTAPYLSSYTGLFFKDFGDFKKKLKKILNNPQHFTPRKWLSQNMSDEVIAKKIYKKILSC